MRIPSNNLFLMISSAFLAIILWLWVGAEERSEIIVSVPLEYRNLPHGFEIGSKEDLLSKVSVWVRGGAAAIKNLQPQEISVWVDLKDTKAGERIFSLGEENVRAPFGLTVLRFSPPQVSLVIEKIERRMVPVKPSIEGEPAAGFTITEKVITPSQVEIIGPQTEINSVREAITDSIDVSGISANEETKVKIGVENDAVRLGNTHEVSVLLKVSEVEDILALRHIPIIITDTEKSVRINPRVVRIDVRLPRSLLTKVKESDVMAYVDTKGLSPGIYDLTPRIEFQGPERQRISVQSIAPARIHVRIE